MPELTRVAHPTYSPGKCFACGATEGPFVDLSIEWADLATADGMVSVQGHLYLCIGRDEMPGCVPQMARLAGCLDAQQAEGLREHVRAHETRLVELEQELEQERAQSKVVPVDELLELLEERQTAKAADAGPG